MYKRTCVLCEVVFIATDKRQIYCSKSCNSKACYRRRLSREPLPLSTEFTCPECGCLVPAKPRRGPQSTYCSPKCAQRAYYARHREHVLAEQRARSAATRLPKVCPACSSIFTPERTNRQIYCSRACLKRSGRDSATTICARDDCDRPVRAKGLCNSHYKAQHPNRKAWKRNGDLEVRRANLRRKTQQRRARAKGDADAPLIDRDSIGERDGWRCGLCVKPVDRDLAYPHPRSASLDHIVPLSLGGKHALRNVQIAHLDCNMAKGNRVIDVQPLLIGEIA